MLSTVSFILVTLNLSDRLRHISDLRQDHIFKLRCIGYERIHRTNTPDRCIENSNNSLEIRAAISAP